MFKQSTEDHFNHNARCSMINIKHIKPIVSYLF